jgi:hypothetical protein
MKYLVELVFGIGFFGLGAIALTFFLRFILLTWAVRLMGRIVQSFLIFLKRLCHALIFIFAPALLGAFVVGLALQIGANAAATGPEASADPTMPVLIAFLTFFVTVAVRSWQWNARRHRRTGPLQNVAGAGKIDAASEIAYLSAGCEKVGDAWVRALALAPERRDDLLGARDTCAELLTAADLHDNVSDNAIIETAALIRERLAVLVTSTERRLRDAQPSERKAIIDEMVKFLLGFAQRARQDIQATNLFVDEEDAAMRAHLATQLFQRGARAKRVPIR